MQAAEDNPYLRLLSLEQEIRDAQSETALQLVIVNRLRSLINARHLMLFRLTPSGQLRICRISDADSVDRNSALATTLEDIANRFQRDNPVDDSQATALSEMAADISTNIEWLQESCLWVPVKFSGGKIGVLWLSRDIPFSDQERVLADHISSTFAHAWKAIIPARQQWLSIFRNHRLRWGLVALLFLVMFMPVRMSVLATAEVTAYRPELAVAPINGVIKEILVTPHEEVSEGQPLLAFEDTGLRNQYNLAREELAVAEAQLRKVQQQSFTDVKSSGKLAELEASVQLKRAELKYSQELLERSVVNAQKAGIVVYRDENDWSGRPVQQGERILYVADANSVEVEIMLPVRDAITLEPGTEVRLFLDTDPLNPLSAQLNYASYDAEVTPEGVLAYRLKATFDKMAILPRIGLQGTAKLYGEHSTLFMYLFRRPLVFLRQWFGF